MTHKRFIIHRLIFFFTISFGYNAVISLNYDDSAIDMTFSTFACLAFVFSVVIISWSNYFSLNFIECRTIPLRIQFIAVTVRFYYLAIMFSVLSLICIFATLALLGNTKTDIANYHMFADILTCGICLSVAVMALEIGRALYHYHRVVRDNTLTETYESDMTEKVLRSQLSNFVASVSFMAFGILFMLYFYDGNGTYAQCFCYLVFLMIAFSAAICNIVISNSVLFLIGQLPQTQRTKFCHLLHNECLGGRILVYLIAGLFFWVLSMTLLPKATFHNRGYSALPSPVFGTLALLGFIASTVNILRVNNNVENKTNTNTNTNEKIIIEDLCSVTNDGDEENDRSSLLLITD